MGHRDDVPADVRKAGCGAHEPLAVAARHSGPVLSSHSGFGQITSKSTAVSERPQSAVRMKYPGLVPRAATSQALGPIATRTRFRHQASTACGLTSASAVKRRVRVQNRGSGCGLTEHALTWTEGS